VSAYLRLDGMGNHSQWERNSARSNRLGLSALERCNHCQKPLQAGKGYNVQYDADADCLVPFDEAITETLFSGLRRLGDDCARRWYSSLPTVERGQFFRS
jgi:hypothetical protein